MSSYTIELGFLLRGFSDINENPMMYASPFSIIENSRENFFKALGRYPFKIWGDERDQAFKEEFERMFLEYFYMKEIGFQTPAAFYLVLGNFLRRKMPIYCNHWRYLLEEMYVTSTGNSQGTTTNGDSRVIDSKGHSETNGKTESDSNTKSVTKGANTDLPDTQLDLDVSNLDYASQANKTESTSDTKTTGKSNSITDSEDHTINKGSSSGNSITDTFGRNKDVFDIYKQWIDSGYDLFTPLFHDCLKEQIFMPLL